MPYSNYYKKSNLFHGSMLNIMGTRLDAVMIGDESQLTEVWEHIIAETERLHRMLNRFDPTSDISLINSQAAKHPVELNDELWSILTDIQKYHKQTCGFFDVSLRDFSKVILDCERRTAAFAEGNISLDLGGYGKGYAMAQVQKILLQNGVTQALVNFGNSSVLAVGAHPHGEYWSIGIENPFQPGQQLQTCQLYNQSLSVSGNTPQHAQHIFNPLDGKYSAERKIVSVVSNDAVEAEVLSTALMVANEKIKKKIKNLFGNVKINIFVA